MSICYILVTALQRLADCYRQMKNFEDSERLFTKELNLRRKQGGDEGNISSGMRSIHLLDFDFLLI